MAKEAVTGNIHEAQPSKEIWKPQFSVITISGKAGAGNSSAAEKLAQKYNSNLFSAGKWFREKAEARGYRIMGYYKRSIELDMELDAEEEQKMKDAIKTNVPVVVEGKAAGVIATELSRQLSQERISSIARIFLTADEDIRVQRIHKRESSKQLDLEKTIEQVREDTRDREKRDLIRFKALHPELLENPLYPDDNQQVPFYDLVVDTSRLSEDEVTEEIHKYLLSKGLVKAT